MTESDRISKLFQGLYNGNPWIEVTMMEKLAGLSAEEASRQLFPHWNSIWAIVNHLIAWRSNVLQRVEGKEPITPDHNYFERVEDTSEAAWRKTLDRLQETQSSWQRFLHTFDESQFENIYPGNQMTFYENIMGIHQHDAYHLGQISLLIKANG